MSRLETIGLQDHEKVKEFSDIEKLLKSAQQTKKTLKLETRLVTDVRDRKSHEKTLANLTDELSNLKTDLENMKSNFEKEALMDGHGEDGIGDYDDEDAAAAGDAMLGEAAALQDKSQDSLDNIKNMVADSKEVGLTSLEELKRQRETLDRIDQEFDRVDGALDQADKLVKQFGKRMASDRFIQCFAVINVLLLVGVIVFSVVNGGKGSGEEAAVPASPVATAVTAAPQTVAPTAVRFLRGSWEQHFEDSIVEIWARVFI